MITKARRGRILVADDYPDAADIAAELLRLAGYEVASAYNGAQALETARTFRPDLVILDIDMPVLNGLDTARALRKEQLPGARLVLIALTGRIMRSDQQASLDAGFDRHVKKPLLGDDLCDLVAAYLWELGPPSSLPIDEPGDVAAPPMPMPGPRPDDKLD